MPLWPPVAGVAGAVVGLGFLVKAQPATDEQHAGPSMEQQHGPWCCIGVVTLHRKGAMTHKLLKHRDMEKILNIEQQTLTQCQACPFVVRYYGPIHREKDTVLVMEMLQGLCLNIQQCRLVGQ